MDFIRGVSRNQVILFPESVEDYITEDNPVRFSDAFAGSLELGEFGFRRVNPADTGRPAYDPADQAAAVHLWVFEPRAIFSDAGTRSES